MSGASLLISLCLPRSGEEHPSGPNAWTGGSKGIDAEELLAEAARLGAFLPVFQNLKSLGLVEESPGMAEWHKRFRNICARNLALEREGRRLLEMLDRAGVTCRLIKGVQLTNLLYPDLSWREVSDVDFVVAGAELADAYQCLKHNGLQDAGNRWNPKALERAAREPSYTFPQLKLIGSGRLLVELHWDWITPRLPAGDVSEDKEALLVYLCRHAGKHFWCSPQWCCDIELYLRKFEEQLDWERFWKLAKKVEAERSCAASFQLCALLFGRALRSEQTQVANRAARKLSAAAARQMFEGPSQGWRKRPLVRLLQVYNWKQRIRRFWGWLAPAPKHWTHAGRSSEPTLEVWIGRYRRLALRLAARALPAGLWRGRFQKASELSTRDWMWLGRAYGTLILVRLALRALPFEKVSGWATRVGPKSRPSEDLEPSVLRRAWLADVAADHHLVEMSCLPRALALTRMLGQAGVPCELKLGVRHQDGKVAGHAWVQWRGRPLNDPNAPHQQYEELTPVGAAKRIAEIDAGSGE